MIIQINKKKMDSIYQSIGSLELDVIDNFKSKLKHIIEQELFTFTNIVPQNSQAIDDILLVKSDSFELANEDEFKDVDNTDNEEAQKIHFNCKFYGDLKLFRA